MWEIIENDFKSELEEIPKDFYPFKGFFWIKKVENTTFVIKTKVSAGNLCSDEFID